tara:strand:- start:627 stop:1643 length:1017 start_codon:yes stop_codon:yes gene_type:complete
MLNIKLSMPGTKSNVNISQFTDNDENIVGNCQFFINTNRMEKPDFWFVIEDLDRIAETSYVSKSNLFFLTNETFWQDDYWTKPSKKGFLNQFSSVYSNYDTVPHGEKALPFLPWMINANHGDSIFENHERDKSYFTRLENIKKSKEISMVVSNKIFSPDHQLRFDFAKSIKDHFKDKIDWYGFGVKNINQKWEGISPYKYHIALENKTTDFVISEKLYDSFLGLSYPIYSGAPNVFEYFPKDSLTAININDVDESIEKIEKLIENKTYEKNLKYLLAAKELVLTTHNLFNRIVKIANTKLNNNNENKSFVRLKSVDSCVKKYELTNGVQKSFFKLLGR